MYTVDNNLIMTREELIRWIHLHKRVITITRYPKKGLQCLPRSVKVYLNV